MSFEHLNCRIGFVGRGKGWGEGGDQRACLLYKLRVYRKCNYVLVCWNQGHYSKLFKTISLDFKLDLYVFYFVIMSFEYKFLKLQLDLQM